MALVGSFLEILGRPTTGGVFLDMLLFLVPVWIAFFVGVLVGWIWKPRWVTLDSTGKFNLLALSSPFSGISSPLKGFGLALNFNSCEIGNPSFRSSGVEDGSYKQQVSAPFTDAANCSSSQLAEKEPVAVTEKDLEHLSHLVERKDGGPAWKHMMDRSAPGMSYQAWQRDPQIGPPQYCSRTIYENVTPELLRDFFWDDEFRLKWDDMLLHSATIEECLATGTMVVHWIRKFPFFCSDREYTIGRRIWESGRSYYCVTKGVPCPSVPRRDKPRRVDLYYSSWCIQAGCTAASQKRNGQQPACEVTLFHHEDMGIPWEIAKLGVRQGMWGAVKKIERGLRAYQKARASGSPLSRSAFMAQINTKINPEYLESLERAEHSPEAQALSSPGKPAGLNIPRLLVFGGAVVVACSLDRGLLTKVLVFGVARRLGNIGRRL